MIFFKKHRSSHKKATLPSPAQADFPLKAENSASLDYSFPTFLTYKDIEIDGYVARQLEVLKRLNKVYCNSEIGGIINAYDSNVPQLAESFSQNGLLSVNSLLDNMSLLTVEQLKNILRDNSLKTSGKKEELIERIQANISRDLLTKSYPQYEEKIYTITPLGHSVLEQYYIKKESILASVENEIYSLVLGGELNSAFRLSSYFLLNEPLPKSIFTESEGSISDGLSNKRLSNIESFVNNNSVLNRQYCALVVTAFLLGEDFTRLRIMAERVLLISCNESEESELSTYFDTFKRLMVSARDLDSFFAEGIVFYRFLAALDGRTCEICGALDGKIFPVSEAKIGINFPPMHNGCRCTTTAVMDEENRVKLKRRAVDPDTGDTVLIPAETTYTEWRSKFYKIN